MNDRPTEPTEPLPGYLDSYSPEALASVVVVPIPDEDLPPVEFIGYLSGPEWVPLCRVC